MLVTDTTSTRALRRLRRIGETCLWTLIIAATAIAIFWVAGQLRIVVLPIGLAVVLATFLWPATSRMRSVGLPRGAAAAAVLGVALTALTVLLALLAPQTIDEFGELDVGISGGLERIEDWLVNGTLGLSSNQVDDVADRIRAQAEASAGTVAGGALSGALLLIEVIAAALIAVVVLFFFLKDGDRIWTWICGLFPPEHHDAVAEIGSRSWTTLGAFLRGQGLVALFDAVFIGLALVIIGTPLVLPLVVLTFFGAFIPIIGAFAAGAAAVLVALVFQGFTEALIVLAAIVVVQQIESNVFAPVIVGRSVNVHPLAILLAVTIGVTLGGIIGALVAAPLLAVGSTILAYLRERADAAMAAAEELQAEGESGLGARRTTRMGPTPHTARVAPGENCIDPTREDDMTEKAEDLKGRTKEAAGDLTGDESLQRDGKVDQASSTIKEKVGDGGDKVKAMLRRDDAE